MKALYIKLFKQKQKKDVSISPYFYLNYSIYSTFLNILLPFEPTLFPKLQVYFADFPYLRYSISPEAINLEDLMRLLVRHELKIICIFFPQTHHFSRNKSNTQLLEKINKFLKFIYLFSNKSLKIKFVIKANRKYFSEQIKLDTL